MANVDKLAYADNSDSRAEVSRNPSYAFAQANIVDQTAMVELFDLIAFYNHRRLHSALGYLIPTQFQRKRLADQLRQAA